MQNWKASIGSLILIKQRVREADKLGLWPYHLPKVAATEAELRSIEERLGFLLDAEYRTFLEHANGWPGLLQDIDLFGAGDLIEGEIYDRGQHLLGLMSDEVLQNLSVKRKSLLVIAASPNAPHLFAMAMPDGAGPSRVVWLMDRAVDEFRDFDDFFLSMVEHNKLEMQKLRQQEI